MEDDDPIAMLIKYKIEAGFLALFLISIVVFWVGSSENQRIAQAWHMKSLPIIRDNFCYVGLEDGREDTKLE